MAIKIEKINNKLIFWPLNDKNEKIVNGIIRDSFELAGFTTDRCWNDEQANGNQPLGMRVSLTKSRVKFKLSQLEKGGE